MTYKPRRGKQMRTISRFPYTLLIFGIFGLRILSMLPKKTTDVMLTFVYNITKSIRRG